MNGARLLQERISRRWKQRVTARKLNVSQPYLSLLEAGKRAITDKLARRAVRVFKLPPTALPIKESAVSATEETGDLLASQLAGLGYPKFSHFKKTGKINPAEVLITALESENLDSRVVEALPWLIYHFAEMSWEQIFRRAKLSDAQNRLGFLLTLARREAEMNGDEKKKKFFKTLLAALDKSRLLREDSFNRVSLTEAEKDWLKKKRTTDARHWHVLSNLSAANIDF